MPSPASPAPVTALRQAVRAMLEAEFAGEFHFKDGKLHSAHPGGYIGIYPVQEAEGRRVLDQDSAVRVQVFLPWTAQVRPDFVADPAAIETVAQRMRERFYSATHPYAGSAGVWDLRLVRVDYEEDPIGQVTRLGATIVSIGQNFAETSA